MAPESRPLKRDQALNLAPLSSRLQPSIALTNQKPRPQKTRRRKEREIKPQ
jgi:hypothetical protein